MKKNHRHYPRLLTATAALFCFLLTLTQLYAFEVKAQEKKDNIKESTTTFLVDTQGDNGFEYIIEDRADPFLSFLQPEKTPDASLNEIVDIEGELEGMQLFEPGQLTLVAIVQSARKQFAMVQDFTGKGYIITEGIKIGKRGVITDIVPNQVVIEETAFTRAGKKLTNEVIMYLKQEGEEQ